MNRFKKFISLTLSLVLLATTLVGCGGGGTDTGGGGSQNGSTTTSGGETRVYNLAIDSPEDTVTYLFSKKFSELVYEKTNGSMQIDVYSNGALGGDREILESLQNGDIAFVVQTTAPQVNFVPELAVFDLPNLFPNAEIARKVLDGPFFDEISKYYEQNNIKLLAYADQGFRVMSSNVRVDGIEDFRGQKIRTMENPYHLAYWQALGANPTPMAFAEVYIGLQQGTIDAQENPYEVIVSAKLYEQQDYVINTNHLLHILALVGSPHILNGLSAEEQEAVMEAAQEAKVWAREQADLRVEDRINIITSSGTEIVDLSEELMAEMANRASSVYDEIRAAVGDELVDMLLSEVEKITN